MGRNRRDRRRLTVSEIEALRALADGHRPRNTSQIGAIAALVAAIATLISAVTASALAIVDRIIGAVLWLIVHIWMR